MDPAGDTIWPMLEEVTDVLTDGFSQDDSNSTGRGATLRITQIRNVTHEGVLVHLEGGSSACFTLGGCDKPFSPNTNPSKDHYQVASENQVKTEKKNRVLVVGTPVEHYQLWYISATLNRFGGSN